MLLVWRGDQEEKEHIDEDEMLVVRSRNKTLLVRRLAQQEEQGIDEDETLLVRGGVQRRRSI